MLTQMTHTPGSPLPVFKRLIVCASVATIFGAVLACDLVEPVPTPTPHVAAKAGISAIGANVQPGETRKVEVRVTNTGNVPHTFQVEASLTGPDDRESDSGRQELRLEPGQEVPAIWSHTFADQGTWQVEANVFSEGGAEPIATKRVADFASVEPCDGVDVYRVWIKGFRTDDCELLGLRMLWWGRIGQLLALGSVVALVAEFAGSSRLREAGVSLRGVEVPKALAWVTWIYRNKVKAAGWTGAGLALFFVVLAISLAIFGDSAEGDFGPVAEALLTTILLAIFVILAAITLPVSFAAGLVIMDNLALKPLAALLERGEVGLKLTSFVILLFGLHFTVLAT